MKIAPEGYPFIIGSLLITVIVLIVFVISWKPGNPNLSSILLFVGCFFLSCITCFMFYFFRDPDRIIPEGKNIFVSPADGKIILIRDVFESGHLKTDTKQISIFMSPFNVHVNRAPCDGRVLTVQHTPGLFLAAYKEDAPIRNENIAMVLEGGLGKVLVRQVAGFIARRAVCRVTPGEHLLRGERYGMIKFSSRLDVYLPKDTKIRIKAGDKVLAGETVLGEL